MGLPQEELALPFLAPVIYCGHVGFALSFVLAVND